MTGPGFTVSYVSATSRRCFSGKSTRRHSRTATTATSTSSGRDRYSLRCAGALREVGRGGCVEQHDDGTFGVLVRRELIGVFGADDVASRDVLTAVVSQREERVREEVAGASGVSRVTVGRVVTCFKAAASVQWRTAVGRSRGRCARPNGAYQGCSRKSSNLAARRPTGAPRSRDPGGHGRTAQAKVRQAELPRSRGPPACPPVNGGPPCPAHSSTWSPVSSTNSSSPAYRWRSFTAGCLWSEGPVYFPAGDYLLWSDIPNNRMYQWIADLGVRVLLYDSNYSNGNTRDPQGRLSPAST